MKYAGCSRARATKLWSEEIPARRVCCLCSSSINSDLRLKWPSMPIKLIVWQSSHFNKYFKSMTDIVLATLMAKWKMAESPCPESTSQCWWHVIFRKLAWKVSMSMRSFYRSRSSTSFSFCCHIFGQLDTSLSSASSHWATLFSLFLLLFSAAIINFKFLFSQFVCLVRCLFAKRHGGHIAVTSLLLGRFAIHFRRGMASWHSSRRTSPS